MAGIFCLEGEWWGNYKRPTTVEPALELLKVVQGTPYVHRNVATIAELEFYVEQWLLKKHSDHPVLYLAFHGQSGFICVGDQRRSDGKVGLNWIEEKMGGQGADRLIYFGSCSTLNLHGNQIKGFLNRTGLEGVVGYKSDVDWMDSMFVDLSMLGSLANATKMNANAIEGANRETVRRAGRLCDELQFRVVVR